MIEKKKCNKWTRGGKVTQMIANPFIPVRFWTWPPKKLSCIILLIKYVHQYSSVAQLVEQLTVNQLVAGSSPARGAKISIQPLKLYYLLIVTTY